MPDLSQWLYPENLEKAANLQRQLSQQVVIEDCLGPINIVAGTDVSNNPYDEQKSVYATCVLLDKNSLAVQTVSNASHSDSFPYIPGYLGFREAPALVKAIQKLNKKPDLILVDGHGISHPRGLGIASHIGVLLDIPTIGVAKSILVGKPKRSLEDQPGDITELEWKGKTIGFMLKTKKRCNPLIIAPGHRISFETSLQIVNECLRGYRLPEPTRQAHLESNKFRKSVFDPI
ncbi:MAG: nfi [Chlamydiales bacterium]|jgi:deoxyribonuclease V|nr:nfi [Chlamydiales bacterium]